MQDVPTAIHYFRTNNNNDNNNNNNNKVERLNHYLAIGDSAGVVVVITFDPEFGEVGSKKKNQILFAEAVRCCCYRTHLHKDWVTEVTTTTKTKTTYY